jgi:PAS domain S-box-containing protein
MAGVRTKHAGAEGRFRDLIEWLPVVVYEAEPGSDGAWLYVSPHLEEMLGYTAKEMIADTSLWAQRLHPDDRSDVFDLELAEAEMARDRNITTVSEYRMLHRDGHVVWIRDEARLVPVEGATPYWRGVLIDITEARSAERELAESHDRYRELVNGLPVCGYQADPDSSGRREFLSQQVSQLLGYSLEEWSTDDGLWEATLHPEDRSRVLRDEDRHVTMAPGTPWVSEYRLLTRSSREIWVRDRAVVTERAGGGRVIEGILTDVTTERGDTERISLQEALAELATARRKVETLLDGLHRHLETISSSPERGGPGVRPAVERRIVSQRAPEEAVSEG